MKFHNKPLEETSGVELLSPAEVLVLKTFGCPCRLEIVAGGQEYKVADTGLHDTVIYDQDDDAEDGWNTVYGDTWKSVDDNIPWNAVTAAVRVTANPANTGTVQVSWEIDV